MPKLTFSLKIKNTMAMLLGVLLLGQSGCLLAATSSPISGRSLGVDTILPADVLARTQLLIKELQLIRLEMGKTEKQYQPRDVLNASPREVYYQVVALFNKANRMADEQTGLSRLPPRSIDSSRIRSYHVWLMIDATLEQVLAVKKHMQIPEVIAEKEVSDTSKSDDVYSAIVDANRLINALLVRPFSPSDVYEKMSASIYTMAQILATFPGVERLPEPSAFERHKKPIDVYKRLLACRELLIKIAAAGNQTFIIFLNMADLTDNIVPSDVYDFASLIEADISYLHSLRALAKPAAKAYYPDVKRPSHVYQRASILKQQLENLLAAVNKNADWLKQ